MSNKILIIYGSTTGMTEIASEEVEAGLKEAGIEEVTRLNVVEADISDIRDFEYIVFGSSTWDNGCLQYDFEPFHDQLMNTDLTGKKFAVFGTGDKIYGESYCQALKTIASTVKKQGGELLINNLEIECDLTDDRIQEIKGWARNLGHMIIDL